MAKHQNKLGIAAMLAAFLLVIAMPSAESIIAQNCGSGTIDQDCDGYNIGQQYNYDCNDNNPNIHPGATEICGNNIDDNCNSQADENCGNISSPPTCGNSVCEVGETYGNCPQDCFPDNDQDGYYLGVQGAPLPYDCHDYDPTIHPNAQEICDNGVDENCNGFVDEGCPKKTNLLFWNQTFRGCGLNTTEQLIVNSTFQANLNFAKGATNETECRSFGSWYCDSGGKWKSNMFTSELNPTNKAKVAGVSTTPDGSQKGCCPSGWCFKGGGLGCYPNQTGHYGSQDSEAAPFSYQGQDYRCASGTWVPYVIKWDWNHQYNGTCDGTDDCYNSQETSQSSDDDCTVNKSFPANPSFGDHYCVAGSWTTRTKFLALQLLQFVADNSVSDYVLFCDEYGKTLNEYQYVSPNEQTVPQGSLTRNVEDFISQGCSGGGACANNFCILRYGDTDSWKGKVIAAVSLNQPIGSGTYSFLNTLNASNSTCNSAQTPNVFTYCGIKDNVRIFYNPTARSVVFTKESVTSLSGQNFFTAVISTITNLINRIFGNPPPSGLSDISFLTKIGDFNRIYIARHAGIDTTAILEKKTVGQAMLINYTGFDFDVCAVDQIKNMQTLGYLNCSINESSYYVASDQPSAIALWPDFTAKLRQK